MLHNHLPLWLKVPCFVMAQRRYVDLLSLPVANYLFQDISCKADEGLRAGELPITIETLFNPVGHSSAIDLSVVSLLNCPDFSNLPFPPVPKVNLGSQVSSANQALPIRLRAYKCETCGTLKTPGRERSQKWYSVVKGLNVGVKAGLVFVSQVEPLLKRPSDEGKAFFLHPDVWIRRVIATSHRTRQEAELKFLQAFRKGEVEVLDFDANMRPKKLS